MIKYISGCNIFVVEFDADILFSFHENLNNSYTRMIIEKLIMN